MKTCPLCGDQFDAAPAVCRSCWYSGALLAKNLRGTIDVLEKVTGVHWYAEHTGGGCAALVARIDGGHHYDQVDDCPHIMVTKWPDVMSLDDTVATIEQDGWYVGAYADYWAGDEPVGAWPADPAGTYGLHTEELPMIVRQAQLMLLNRKGQPCHD